MAVSDNGSIAVLAEKPSVARDIARVLGATKQGDGYLQGNGYVVTWAIGHLVTLAQPHEINPEWRQWRRDSLPIIPERWPLVTYEKTRDQFEIVRKILNSPRISRIICATDAGREGELIFRYIYEAADCEKPFDRLWISSLTPDAIRKGFEALRPGSDYDSLADAASGRSRADWLVGMNLSRSYSLAFNEELSVGRVQTPTLAMVVARELALQRFVPQDYIEVVASFHPTEPPGSTNYESVWFQPQKENAESSRLPADGLEAAAIVARAKSGKAQIESINSENQRTLAPLFYDLTELQRHANRLFGFSAQKTLDVAQALYERHKLISYPRTDSRYLSQDVAKTLPRIVDAIVPPYAKNLAPGTGDRPLGPRFVDDAKVTDHHAIIPTAIAPAKAGLSGDERKLYDLVCRRLLSAWHDDYVVSVTTLVTSIVSGEIADKYHTSGTAVQQIGWKILDLAPERKKDAEQQALPEGLVSGQKQDVLEAKAVKKKTRPPKRFTEATLLTAMETAGKTLEEKELSEAMKESGLGTPATRAAIIEVLLKRGYIARNGKSLEATRKGIRLIEIVHPEVKSPAMTGQWEAYLQRIQRGRAQLKPFLDGIESYVRDVVGKVGEVRQSRESTAEINRSVPAPAFESGKTLREVLNDAFGFASFRPNQEAVCRAAIEGCDVLLVMPTGSGKSLCYQLPGLLRGGTTLVISPLIALMEDQVAKLLERGFNVERIHSGRDRGASRQACLDYLEGRLQFLFIAPERLRVSGFPEMLAKRKPSLIAVDEAHCISQWGHDFRPDYRMLRQHLPALRPAPVMALTATATPLVQKDIAEQLGLTRVAQFIHGFRRENIAIEVVEVPPSSRARLVSDILRECLRRPAIVYAPTRRQSEELAVELSSECRTAAYHAGLDSRRRAQVQADFIEGKLDVMMATIAFGMGIDKPDVRTVIHTALPGSLEGYYQEIGRAGRDGEPSRAILMQSYADRHTHDFFFERDYPDIAVLDQIYAALKSEPLSKAALQKRLRLDPDLFDKALEKLWTHSGAVIDSEENISRGEDCWRPFYTAQGKQKAAQIEGMLRYAAGSQCRMAALVHYFGDFADRRDRCGICDFCAPEQCVAQCFRDATHAEQQIVWQIHMALRSGSRSTGKLYTQLCAGAEMTRNTFEEVLAAMARAGIIQHEEAVLEKDGNQIPYRNVKLTLKGHRLDEQAAVDLRIKDVERAPAQEQRRRRKTKMKTRKEPEVAAKTLQLEEALRKWRLAEARSLGIPAFRIFSDRVLRNVASKRPTTEGDLLSISGVGLAIVKKYGRHIYRLVRDSDA